MMRNTHKTSVGKFEWNKSLERSRRRQEDSIKTELKEIRCGGVDWIRLAQGPVEGSSEDGNEPWGSTIGE
jgi:hypothetical protein